MDSSACYETKISRMGHLRFYSHSRTNFRSEPLVLWSVPYDCNIHHQFIDWYLLRQATLSRQTRVQVSNARGKSSQAKALGQ
jgi:hypothetical protein